MRHVRLELIDGGRQVRVCVGEGAAAGAEEAQLGRRRFATLREALNASRRALRLREPLECPFRAPSQLFRPLTLE